MKRILPLCLALLLCTGCGSKPMQQDTLPSAADTQTADAPTESASPAEPVTLTMAVGNSVTGTPIGDLIDAFNAEDNGYTIVTKDYSKYMDMKYAETYEGTDTVVVQDDAAFTPMMMQLQMDIMQGGVVDIVWDSAFESALGTYEQLMNKGAFADLYPFMENDPEVNTSTLDAHILQLHETDGELRCLPICYSVSTLLGNPDYVGTKENWTFEEMTERFAAAPDGLTFNYAEPTKNYVYYAMLRGALGDFVDYDSVSCSFDSPLFVNMLTFCNSFPDTPPVKTDTGNPDDFVYERYIYGYGEYHSMADDTLVGYPSEDGGGAFARSHYYRYSICRDSTPEAQQGAWEFLRRMALEDFQYDNITYNEESVFSRYLDGFPINLAAGERYAGEMIEKNENGTPNPYTAMGVEHDAGWLSQAEYDHMRAYIDSIKKLDSSLDRSLQNIVEEEIWRMFSGEQTPEQCAKAIQGRAEIMVSEQS